MIYLFQRWFELGACLHSIPPIFGPSTPPDRISEPPSVFSVQIGIVFRTRSLAIHPEIRREKYPFPGHGSQTKAGFFRCVNILKCHGRPGKDYAYPDRMTHRLDVLCSLPPPAPLSSVVVSLDHSWEGVAGRSITGRS